MTLIACQPRDLDELALRLLDASAKMRALSKTAQQHELTKVKLHRGKLEEWLLHIELWLHRAEGQVQAAVHEQLGAQLANAAASEEPPRTKGRR